MKESINLAIRYEAVTEQAGQILVSLGRLLTNLPELCESDTRTGALLIRIGSKLATQNKMQRETLGRIA